MKNPRYELPIGTSGGIGEESDIGGSGWNGIACRYHDDRPKPQSQPQNLLIFPSGRTYRLRVLHEPADVSKILVDTIFTHGPPGDPHDTWMGANFFL